MRWYQDPNGINYRNKNDHGPYPRRYYLDGVLDTEKHQWMVVQMYDLAKLYHLTQEPEIGRRTMLILDEYSRST